MTTSAALRGEAAASHDVPAWINFLIATACGLIVANIYYAQPLVGPIAAEIGLSPEAAGLIVTLTQVGYGLGLLLIVPLGDLIENRRLILAVVGVASLALLGAALSTDPALFLAVSLMIGLGSVAVQILVPFAAHLAPEHARGRAVGNVMSGLMLGIMLARPVSSAITELASWRTVYALSLALMIALSLTLWRLLPRRFPEARSSYGGLLASMGRLAVTTPVLQRRALYQACLFAAFSLFWTASPLWLTSPVFGLSHGGVAAFAFAGVAGAVAAPIAGSLADRGLVRPATAAAMVFAAIAFLMTWIAEPGSTLSLVLLTLAAILLDFGVSANVVLGQREIFALGAEVRSRLNGLYMAFFFVGGAIGSGVGGWAMAEGGWPLASSIGVALPLLALAGFALLERRTPASGKSR